MLGYTLGTLLARVSGDGPIGMTAPPWYASTLMFAASTLFLTVGTLKLFAPGILVRFAKWRRQKMGLDPSILDGVEGSRAWSWSQRIPGVVALGFGLLLLVVLVRSLIR